jgi:hypothetical protein
MIGLADVKLCIITGTQKALYRLTNRRQWIEVFLRNLIEATKIHARPQGAGLLRHKEDWSLGWGL